MPLKDGELFDIDNAPSLASLKGENITIQEAVLVAQIQKALKGDVKAFRVIVELSGQLKPSYPWDSEDTEDDFVNMLKQAANVWNQETLN